MNIETAPNTLRAAENARPVTASDIVSKLKYEVGKDPSVATELDWLHATILAVRDRIIDAWMDSTYGAWRTSAKRVYYLSLEFLIGRLMRDAMSNIGVLDDVKTALTELGVDFGVIAALEPDAALGNGGLGRLAACFMESMATVGIPAHGYGIRYANGMFRQEIADGWQAEYPETWLIHGNPWEFERAERAYEIGFGGHVEEGDCSGDEPGCVWKPGERVEAVAYDTPIVGWRAARVNTLRLWQARPIDPIRLDAFNAGDHLGALEESNRAEAISRVLYPADSHMAGKELRLRQEYFFSSASLQDILTRHLKHFGTLDNLADKVAIQLNDTHPAIAVAEMVRLLCDTHGYGWEAAWAMTRGVFSYTNHTLLPEALETWPVPLMERMLPRHMQIIYRINAAVLTEARIRGGSDDRVRAVSLIDENGERRVRMGQLAFVGSHSINGVSALHTELMKQTVFSDLHAIYPDRINNKTNGVTPRRWLFQCNPGLTRLARETIGDGFLDDISRMEALADHAGDRAFLDLFAAVKRGNKVRLAKRLKEQMGVTIDPDAMFDIQIKRIHEYKRQLLNIVETVALYDQMRSHPEKDWAPRVKIFAGKAAPSYWTAKVIVKLINDVARVINADPTVRNRLKVLFVPNYNVSAAEVMMPAADLSEQISTAGMEASGTGNMKFALNGALTIGTLDGANVEMRDHVGAENFFIFGMTTEEVEKVRRERQSPRHAIDASPELRQALEAIRSGVFSRGDTRRYADLVQNIYDHDWFMVARDFDAYAEKQREVDAAWRDRDRWNAMAVRNTARMGFFSSDRAIREYARDIWRAGPGYEAGQS